MAYSLVLSTMQCIIPSYLGIINKHYKITLIINMRSVSTFQALLLLGVFFIRSSLSSSFICAGCVKREKCHQTYIFHETVPITYAIQTVVAFFRYSRITFQKQQSILFSTQPVCVVLDILFPWIWHQWTGQVPQHQILQIIRQYLYCPKSLHVIYCYWSYAWTAQLIREIFHLEISFSCCFFKTPQPVLRECPLVSYFHFTIKRLNFINYHGPNHGVSFRTHCCKLLAQCCVQLS
jgi:hypothetical protein